VREGVEHPPHHTHFLEREKFRGLDFGVSEKPLETPLFTYTYEFRKTELDFGGLTEEFRRAGGVCVKSADKKKSLQEKKYLNYFQK